MEDLSLKTVLEVNAINGFKQALQQGANINGVDEQGCSALHKAAYGGYNLMASFLLEQGIDKTLKDNAGYDALFYALSQGHTEVAKLIQNKEL